MIRHTNIIGLFTMALLVSCKKPDLPTPVKPVECWQKFVGDYVVYDTAAGISYPMIIRHVLDTNFSGEVADFLQYENFDNQFVFNVDFTCYNPSNYTSFGQNINVPDKSGNHYNIWDQEDDTSTTIKNNYLLKDTIHFYFRVENTAYWLIDGVSYMDVYKHQIAVKQH